MLRETVLVSSLHLRQRSSPGADPAAPTPPKVKEAWDRCVGQSQLELVSVPIAVHQPTQLSAFSI